MGSSKAVCLAVVCASLVSGCFAHHEATVQTALLPPPSEAPVRHTGRLWVELGEATWATQCRAPLGQREVCFANVRRSMLGALSRGLWTSFSEVSAYEGEAIAPGDYRLKLDVSLDAAPPDAAGPGWSAVASGAYRLSRDGKVLVEEKLGSRSRASFAYGSALGVGAGEVIDAFAAHVAGVLASVPEQRPLQAVPLPAVVAETIRAVAPATAASSAPVVTPPVVVAAPPAGQTATPAAGESAEPAPSLSPPTTPVAAR